MQLLHSSIALWVIVQLQHLPHVCPNRTGEFDRSKSGDALLIKNVRLKMAYVSSSRIIGSGFADRITAFAASVKLAAQRRAVYEKTVRDLKALSNRELADLGIARLNIEDVARVAAFGD